MITPHSAPVQLTPSRKVQPLSDWVYVRAKHVPLSSVIHTVELEQSVTEVMRGAAPKGRTHNTQATVISYGPKAHDVEIGDTVWFDPANARLVAVVEGIEHSVVRAWALLAKEC